jgi:hypothetical protein
MFVTGRCAKYWALKIPSARSSRYLTKGSTEKALEEAAFSGDADHVGGLRLLRWPVRTAKVCWPAVSPVVHCESHGPDAAQDRPKEAERHEGQIPLFHVVPLSAVADNTLAKPGRHLRSVAPALFVEDRPVTFRKARGLSSFSIADRAGRSGASASTGLVTFPWPVRMVLTHPAATLASGALHVQRAPIVG